MIVLAVLSPVSVLDHDTVGILTPSLVTSVHSLLPLKTAIRIDRRVLSATATELIVEDDLRVELTMAHEASFIIGYKLTLHWSQIRIQLEVKDVLWRWIARDVDGLISRDILVVLIRHGGGKIGRSDV